MTIASVLIDTENSSSFPCEKKIIAPEISISGIIPLDYKKHRFIKCSMCSMVIDQHRDSFIDHSYLCTGF